MNRKDTTKFLGELLKKERFCGFGKHWASEVTIDYGTTKEKRVDFMQFEPQNQANISGIEKGIFICYEVKSCKADFESGFGKNFIGEKNYFVMPMKLYKEIATDIPHNVGVLVPIPKYMDKYEEYENPTELTLEMNWKLVAIKPAREVTRKKSMVELLFYMLRSGH